MGHDARLVVGGAAAVEAPVALGGLERRRSSTGRRRRWAGRRGGRRAARSGAPGGAGQWAITAGAPPSAATTATSAAPAPRASSATASALRRVSSACAGSAQMLGMRTRRSRSARAPGSSPLDGGAQVGLGRGVGPGPGWSVTRGRLYAGRRGRRVHTSRSTTVRPRIGTRRVENRALAVSDTETRLSGRAGDRRLRTCPGSWRRCWSPHPGRPTAWSPASRASPSRRTWAEVHDRARAMAAALRAEHDGRPGLAPGAAVGVLAGEPVAIAPLAQAVWLCGGSVTMLHQPTARTDLAAWAEDTVVRPQDDRRRARRARAALRRARRRSSPSAASRSARIDDLDGDGATVTPTPPSRARTTPRCCSSPAARPPSPRPSGSPTRNLHANISAMAQAARLDVDRDVQVSWLPLFHDMGMVGFLTVPMTRRAGAGHGHPARLPRPAAAVGRADLQVRRHRDGRPELRLRRPRPPARPRRRRLAGPVVAAHRAQRRRADRPGRRRARSPTRGRGSGCARGGALRVRDGRDRARGGVRAGRDGAAGRRDRRRRPGEHRRLATAPAPARSFPKLGPPLPGIEVRVVGDDGAVLGEREVGVLQLRGASVTPGYLTVDGPVATQDAEGWFDTGDEGYLADGAGRRVRPAQGRDHHGWPQHLPDRHRARRAARPTGCARATPWPCGSTRGRARHRESFARGRRVAAGRRRRRRRGGSART